MIQKSVLSETLMANTDWIAPKYKPLKQAHVCDLRHSRCWWSTGTLRRSAIVATRSGGLDHVVYPAEIRLTPPCRKQPRQDPGNW
jgi:hypothetical protein